MLYTLSIYSTLPTCYTPFTLSVYSIIYIMFQKHMKPVDSVKITKQKFSNPKKQHAKHHDQHIAEESD
ncbi:PAK1IP1 [Bugula neritina]|uniref:PAK1IP1 n=1 Tax=Bugula neritina TaxID=10212 RepID=A0A7J7J266_BUGNE|nr:PAK1IP1 [Bugula neritina]